MPRRPRRLAETNFTKARAAVDDYLTKVTDSQLLTSLGLQPLRRDLLRSALRFYDDFLRERKDDATLRAAQAGVYLRAAKIHRELSDTLAWTEAAANSVKLYEAIAKDKPGDDASREALLEALCEAATYPLRHRTGRSAPEDPSREPLGPVAPGRGLQRPVSGHLGQWRRFDRGVANDSPQPRAPREPCPGGAGQRGIRDRDGQGPEQHGRAAGEG